MPEAPVHEDNRPVACQNNVGLSGELADVQAVAKPLGVQVAPDGKLGLCVAAAD
jgi:hypothetical protein